MTPAGQRWTKRKPITFTCPHCHGTGCEPCQQRGWFFTPLPHIGGQIEVVCS